MRFAFVYEYCVTKALDNQLCPRISGFVFMAANGSLQLRQCPGQDHVVRSFFPAQAVYMLRLMERDFKITSGDKRTDLNLYRIINQCLLL